MPIHTPAIRAFLTKWETAQTVGYIPCRKRNFATASIAGVFGLGDGVTARISGRAS